MSALQSNFNGIQHIGIPVTDMERSKAFYARLGFEAVMERPFEYNGDTGECCMMQRGPAVLELFRMPPAELDEIRRRGNGHIDHVAFGVDNIDRAFEELREAGLTRPARTVGSRLGRLVTPIFSARRKRLFGS